MRSYKYDAIIFDFDGVIVESLDIKKNAFASIYFEHGPEITAQAVKYHLDNSGISRFHKFRHCHKTLLQICLSKEDEYELGKRFSRLVVDAVIKAPFVKGALEFLKANHAITPLFVASGTPEEELKLIISNKNLSCYFTSVHGSPSTKSDIVKNIIKKYDFKPERVVMIGDALSDYNSSVENGIKFIGRTLNNSLIFPDNITVIPDLQNLQKKISHQMETN